MQQATAAVARTSTRTIDTSTVYVARLRPDTCGIPALVVKMIPLFDGTRSVQQVASEAQISMGKASVIVRKLADLGILRTPTLRLNALTIVSEIAATSPFSQEEEAFFAAELEPIDECDEPFAPPLSERASLFISDLILRLKGSPAF